jgi:hypothetical protein
VLPLGLVITTYVTPLMCTFEARENKAAIVNRRLRELIHTLNTTLDWELGIYITGLVFLDKIVDGACKGNNDHGKTPQLQF